jgi:hypothetical protein
MNTNGKTLFECTTKEVAIIRKLRNLKYGKLYIIIQAGSPIRIGIVEKLNLDDNTVKEIVLGEEKKVV